MYKRILLTVEVTDFKNFWIGFRWSWTHSLLSFFFLFVITWARLFNVKVRILIYLVLIFNIYCSSSSKYLLQRSNILFLRLVALSLCFSFQQRRWAVCFICAMALHLSRALGLPLITFAYVVAYLDSILTDSDCVRSFFFSFSCLCNNL